MTCLDRRFIFPETDISNDTATVHLSKTDMFLKSNFHPYNYSHERELGRLQCSDFEPPNRKRVPQLLDTVYENDAKWVKVTAQNRLCFSCDGSSDATGRRVMNRSVIIPGIGKLYFENIELKAER